MIFTRLLVENFIHGAHQAVRMQPGQVFSQYRNYQPGDDLRRLDWKKYARTGKYYVIESEIDSHVEIQIVLDASASMMHQDGQFTKWQIALLLTAASAWLGLTQGDQVEVFVLREDTCTQWKVQNGKNRFLEFLEALIQEKAGGKLNPLCFQPLLQGHRSKKMGIYISDFYEQNGEWSNYFKAAQSPFREHLALQLLGENELNFQFDSDTFLDLETGEEMEFGGNEAAQLWKEKLKKHQNYWQKAMEEYQGIFLSVPMQQALEETLRVIVTTKNKIS